MTQFDLNLDLGYDWKVLANRDSIPQNSVAPIISGDTAIGETLSCTTGTWTESPTSYTYQWNLDGVAVGGATSATWVSAGSIDQVVTCDVVAHNATKDSSTARSNSLTLTAANYDVDAAAYFVAAGITDNTQKSAWNTAVLALKSGSLWTKFFALYPLMGGSAGSHLVNAKTPGTFDITWSGGLTHDANGVTGNGSSGFGDTGLNALSVLSATSNAIFIYTRLTGADGAPAISAYDGSTSFAIVPNDSGTGRFADTFVGYDVTGAVADGQGLFTVSRTASNAVAGYRNTTSIGTNSGGATMPNSTIKLLRFDGIASFSNQNLAAAGISTGLTSGQVTTLQGIIQTFETSLGRQV